MTIEVPVLELVDLADRVRAAAVPGRAAATRLRPVAHAGEVAGALDDTLHAFALTAGALATEAEALGDAVEGTARSWLALDADLLARRREVQAR